MQHSSSVNADPATYDSTTKQLSWEVAYSDLSAPAAADIHGPAAAGKNARLVFWISNNIISQYSRADVFL